MGVLGTIRGVIAARCASHNEQVGWDRDLRFPEPTWLLYQYTYGLLYTNSFYTLLLSQLNILIPGLGMLQNINYYPLKRKLNNEKGICQSGGLPDAG